MDNSNRLFRMISPAKQPARGRKRRSKRAGVTPTPDPPPPTPAQAVDLDDPNLYLNREMSLLAFQRRVLEEARDTSNPLLERVKFLAIVGSNLDEFFMVRVAGIEQQVESGIVDVGPDGMTAAAILDALREEAGELMREARGCWQKDLLPALAEAGIAVLDYAQLDDRQRASINDYFHESVFPVLTPLAFDPGRPFPHISNLSLNLAVTIRDPGGALHFARVKVPGTLPQFAPVNGNRKKRSKTVTVVWLEQVIAANLPSLFPGMEIVEAHPFHVTRNADLEIQELEAADLLETVEESVRQRRFGSVVRLKVLEAMPDALLQLLVNNLEVEEGEVFRLQAPLGLVRLMALTALDRPELKEPPFQAAIPAGLEQKGEDEDIFSAIRRGDILMHHPFDSFQPVVDFLQKAARDPNVLAIKMTLYRVGPNSPVVEALLEAQEHGKQVAVLVELKARFDEESNIEWARALEREGVHVVYGLLGLKIHTKIAMVVRREGDIIRRYVHLATGNYNATTARLYTDLGLLTCDEDIGADATDLFNYLTGYSAKSDYRKLLVAPINLRRKFEALIEREIEHQIEGESGHIILKINSLADRPMIRLLYKASQAGVKVELLVRGICCLRPGVPGVSENITVTSVVGRFLEHSRIYYFRNGGDEQIYLGSADIMNRNINRRVETLFPIEGRRMVRHLLHDVLAVYLADNRKASRMLADGTYARIERRESEPSFSSQAWLLALGTSKGET
jgi:polyphosphate kinase